jgi:hypothetical protein
LSIPLADPLRARDAEELVRQRFVDSVPGYEGELDNAGTPRHIHPHGQELILVKVTL